MVFKVDPSTNKPAPTAKYIYARLADKPIISMEWLHASVEADMIQGKKEDVLDIEETCHSNSTMDGL